MKKLTVNVRRHSISDKTTGEKDYPISAEGINLALDQGKLLAVPEGGIQLYASPKKRAVETADFIGYGAMEAYIATLFREKKCGREEIIQKISEVFNGSIQTSQCLDSMASYITKIPNVKEVFSSMPLDDAVNLVLREDPEVMEWAAGEVCRLIGDVAVTSIVNGNADRDELVELVSHSPKVEAALLRMMTYDYDPTRRRRMYIPDVRIEEVGGAFKETEFFSVEIEVGNGTYRLCKLCNPNKGQEVNIR